jgi:predicted GNAT superfamily acetyltransferase
MNGNIIYQLIVDIDDVNRVVDLQKRIWGPDVITTLPQLIAAVHNGGVIIGAYDDEKIIGFCYGFPCFKNDQIYLCSHMAGIDPNYRNLGIGNQLKFKQRDWALEYGYRKIIWTFDPLESRNAYLNLYKLGGYVRTYIENYYGSMNDPLNQSLPSDRFLVEWDIDSDKTNQNIQEQSQEIEIRQTYKSLVQYEVEDQLITSIKGIELGSENGYLVPVPKDIHLVKSKNIELAKKWRHELRKIFQESFSKGYKAVSLIKGSDSIHYYVLEK